MHARSGHDRRRFCAHASRFCSLRPLAIAGVALINTGLGRSRSAAQALLGNLAIFAVAAIVFALVGASFAGTLPGGSGSRHLSCRRASPGTWLGAGPLLLRGLGCRTAAVAACAAL